MGADEGVLRPQCEAFPELRVPLLSHNFSHTIVLTFRCFRLFYKDETLFALSGPGIGGKERKSMKSKPKYTNEPMGKLRAVDDFLKIEGCHSFSSSMFANRR